MPCAHQFRAFRHPHQAWCTRILQLRSRIDLCLRRTLTSGISENDEELNEWNPFRRASASYQAAKPDSP